MKFFQKYFKNIHELDNGEGAVLCPFPHTDEQGNQYFETRPSAHINLTKSVFHCKVCGKAMSETYFLAQVQGISYKDATILLKEMEGHKHHTWHDQRQAFLNKPEPQELWQSLGLDLNLAEELQIGFEKEGVSFPAFVYGELLDVRNYCPGRKTADGRKLHVISRKKAKSLIIPFDLWIDDDRPTLLCAGEKDMAIARQNGFNAITFTGGEAAFPKLFKASFRGKKIYIAYDNDHAGHEGSRKIASLLKDCGANPYVVTGHYEVCTETGEDIHDFFQKHGRTREDLQKILDETNEFTEEEHQQEQHKLIPLVSIAEAMQGKYSNRLVASRVSVVARYEESMTAPDYVEFEKLQDDSSGELEKGFKTEWVLDEDNIKDVLHLVDSNLKEAQIKTNLKMFGGIPPNEKYVTQRHLSKTTIYKAVVTDDLESEVDHGDDARAMRELLVYSVGTSLESGMKYKIYYKPVPHPYKAQQIVGVISRVEESDTSINRFKVTDDVLASLECFKVKEGEKVGDKLQELYERSKGFIGVEVRKDAFYATELFFHTPLQFKFKRRIERAYLDVMIIGDPRSGKSQTAKGLLDMYELGIITSLKTTTEAGLIGGSDQTKGGWKTKLGILPRNHKSAVIMEEFSGGGQKLVSRLTEIRSSNMVRIDRVNGSTRVPAMVRMLSISNPVVKPGGYLIPLSQEPNGVRVVTDLVGAAEDIARYDYFLLVDEGKYISPLDDFEDDPYPKESYMNRIRWVWSRKPEQINIEYDVMEYIVKLAEELNDEFNSHIKFFGHEAWKKLARVSIATAGLVCSMSEDGQELIVKKEHVKWARNFLVACYDNKLFKLKEYVQAQRKYIECDEDSVRNLQGIYNNHMVALQQMEMETEMSQRQLQVVSGLDMKEFPKFINQMVKYNFFRLQGEKVVPTQKYRIGMSRINREVYMPKLGEEY